jgi:CRP-like cAMP-binding protein
MSGPKFDVNLIVGPEPRTISFTNGGVVFVKGDNGAFAYLVRSGRVEIRGSGQSIEIVGPGGLFGEMALIDGGPRSASAVALADTELVVVDKPTFERLLREVPDFAVGVMQLMSARLRAANSRVTPPGGVSARRGARSLA